MKTEFILYTEKNDKPIVVNNVSNTHLLDRCQNNWSHKLDIKYKSFNKWYNKLGLNFVINNYKKVEYLFIHIPKTGGTSFKFNVIYNPNMKKKIAIYHRINFPPTDEPEFNIFEENKKMFTLLREPLNTVISSYHHFKHINNINFIDFCHQIANMQTKFLLGYDISSNYKVTVDDVIKLQKLIDEKKLVVGIQKTKKMLDIYNMLELAQDKVDNFVLNKKVNIKYKTDDISNDMKKYVKKINNLDQMLFDYALKT